MEMNSIIKTVVLVDGEHYFPVIKAALDEIKKRKKHRLLAAVFVGGTEKIVDKMDMDYFNIPVILNINPKVAIAEAIKKYHPDLIIDLSDEPVVGYYERFIFANIALLAGVSYQGADFRFDPPLFEEIVDKPSISIIGTGKRVGKTAVSAFAARQLKSNGFSPCIVAMGRGGPAVPEVLYGEELEITPEFLLKKSEKGKHAASDHYEDALMSRITTIGCRRCGGGMAGMPFISNVSDGAKIANSLENSFVIFEGSGSAIPPVKVDNFIITIGAYQPIEYISGYFGPYRILRSNLAVLTMCEEPLVEKEKIEVLDQLIRKINPNIKVVHTIFRPKPLKKINGQKVFWVTTAPEIIRNVLKKYLEKEFGCKIVGTSNNLSNRNLLREDMAAHSGEYDLLLTELKAAAVDVVTKAGLEEKLEVVYADNIPVTVGGDGDLTDCLIDMAKLSIDSFEKRRSS